MSMQANQRASDLIEIIEACSYATDSVKPFIANALDEFLMSQHTDEVIDQNTYQALTEKVWVNFWTSTQDRKELSAYPRALLDFVTEAAELEVQHISSKAEHDEDEKLIIKSDVAVLVHQVYRETSEKSVKPVMHEFILDWADRIYFE